jgi:hypothetical protein
MAVMRKASQHGANESIRAERPMTRPRIMHAKDGLAVSQVGPVCVAIWRGNSTPARVAIQGACLTEVVGLAPGRAGFLCVVEETSAPPDEKAREASSRMLNAQGSNLRAVACVIEGSGFRASIVRSVASGIVWLARSKNRAPVSYFAQVTQGAAWLANFVDLGSLEGFARGVEETRFALDSVARPRQ